MSKRFTRYVRNMKTAHYSLAKEMWRVFRDICSGLVKRNELKKMGHPFARLGKDSMRGIKPRFWNSKRKVKSYRVSDKVAFRRYTDSYGKKRIKSQITSKGSINPLPINMQKGKLKNRIKLDRPSAYDPSQTYKLYSEATHGKFVLALLGTMYMVARGVLGPYGYLRQKHRELKLALHTAHKNSLR